jgi:hypothetical protein
MDQHVARRTRIGPLQQHQIGSYPELQFVESSLPMRKLINSTYISLDGVIEGPHLWPSLGRPGDERAGQIQEELALSCDAMLMGRRTYDGFAPVWQTRSGDPVSDHFNAMRKYVVSTTLSNGIVILSYRTDKPL